MQTVASMHGAEGPGALDFQTKLSADLSLAILDCFTCDEPVLTLEQVAEKVGTDRFTAEYLLGLACGRGLLAHEPERGVYGTGIRMLELASAFQCESDLVGAAGATLESVRDALDETTKLIVRWGDYHVGIAQARSRQTFDQTTPLGKPKPLYLGAGKILLANLPQKELEAYLQRTPLVRQSPTTITGRAELLASFATVRRTNFFETYCERNRGGVSFAVPVRDRDGVVIAAVAVSMPLFRYRQEIRERAYQLLTYGAEKISERLKKRQSRVHARRASHSNRLESVCWARKNAAQ